MVFGHCKLFPGGLWPVGMETMLSRSATIWEVCAALCIPPEVCLLSMVSSLRVSRFLGIGHSRKRKTMLRTIEA